MMNMYINTVGDISMSVVTPALADAPRWPWSFGGLGQEPSQFKNPHDCAFTADGLQLIVCDTLNHRVQVLNLDGTFVRYVGNGVGTRDGQLKYPRGVHVDPTGSILVADDTRVQIFTAQGCFVSLLLRMNNQAGAAGIHVHPKDCSIAVTACGEHRAVLL
jgi:DNA-binding beta-propeller fold protein YncE